MNYLDRGTEEEREKEQQIYAQIHAGSKCGAETSEYNVHRSCTD